MTAFHVGMHFPDDTLLSFGQWKGKIAMVEGIEMFTHASESPAHALLLTFAGIGHDDELYEEKLLELQSHVGSCQFVGGGGVMSSP